MGALALFIKSCFAAGTPLLTPEGSKPIEDFKPGDLVLSAPEDNPYATAEPKEVEEVFESRAQVWELRAGGRTILTTEGHPFFVQGRGWTSACDLKPGDLLRGPARLSYAMPLGLKAHIAEGGPAVEDYKEVLPGELTAVESTRPTPRTVPVYNLRIADWHTYFVGSEAWGLAVWAHNVDCSTPYHDPEPPEYNNGAIHMDHEQAAVWGGTEANRPLPAETNLRRGGHDGALRVKYERLVDDLIAEGYTPAAAEETAQAAFEPEISSNANSPPPRPMDPSTLNQLPADPVDQGHNQV
jgi:hypothetical protein